MGWVTPVDGIKTHGEIHTIKSCQTFIYTLYIYIYRRETRGVMVYGKMVNIYGFTSLPCNLLHSIFETRLYSSFLHK